MRSGLPASPELRFDYFLDADHAVTAWLTQNQKFDEILLRCLFGRKHGQISSLATIFALSETMKAAQARNPSVLVDRITEGAPLLLCFADASAETPPRFDLFDGTRALESAMGTPLNRVLLCDPRKQWWLRGVAGLGETCEEVATSLRELTDRMRPSQVICLGNGMGAYAAVCFAMLLGADQALAFAPLSNLDQRFSRLCHDFALRAVSCGVGHHPARRRPTRFARIGGEDRLCGQDRGHIWHSSRRRRV